MTADLSRRGWNKAGFRTAPRIEYSATVEDFSYGGSPQLTVAKANGAAQPDMRSIGLKDGPGRPPAPARAPWRPRGRRR